VTVDPPREGLSAYLAGQGRFRQLAEDGERIAEVVRALDERWAAMGGQAR